MTRALPEAGPPRSAADLAARQAALDSTAAAEHPRCLLCGPPNTLGLKLSFRVEADGSVVAVFPCRRALQGYPDRLHGGVIASLLDAAMTNVLFSIGVAGVTAELTVRFLAPARVDRDVLVRASVETARHPLCRVRSRLEQDGRLVAWASARFLVRGRAQDMHVA